MPKYHGEISRPGPAVISGLVATLKNKPMHDRLATDLPARARAGGFRHLQYGIEFASLFDLNEIGGFVVKGLSREAMPGNPPPRLFETHSGMMNSIGLQNIGVRAFVRDKLPELRRSQTAVFANVFGYASEDYVEVVRVLEDAEGLSG
jgi:dihydroorotate dehydrogenase (NAD+) catalytic subunit